MKKAIIFSLSTGGGHNSAARNLKEIFTESGYEVVIIDTMNRINPKLDHIINKGYETLANKAPFSWGALYKISNREKFSRNLFSFLAKVSRSTILNIIKQEQPDIIIGTHPFVVPFIASLTKEGTLNLPFISVVTDFVAHDIYLNQQVDAYVVGSPFTKADMVKKGISSKRIYPYGIPISKVFTERKTPPALDVFEILVMAGSIGLNYIVHIVDTLLQIEGPLHIRALYGKNKKLEHKMKKRFKKEIQMGRLELYGFVEDIPSLMDQSHCVLTKPGGLSVTESINKHLPLILPHYIPGQEKENLDFLVSNRLAFCVRTPKETKRTMEKIIACPELLDTVRSNMEKITAQYSRQGIVQIADKLIDKQAGRK